MASFSQANLTPEQQARHQIDLMLAAAGWVVQAKSEVDLHASLGVAVREYQTEEGPADYLLFVEAIPVGVIEAKRAEEGESLTTVEEQSAGYAKAKLKHLHNEPLPFVYESTGAITRFTNYRDPSPRSREVFHFHQPETLLAWYRQERTFRAQLQARPTLPQEQLRVCQTEAILNLETSLADNRPRALIQMATGAGKTFTAITAIYRLLKYGKAKRVLFLVDTKNLGEQAEGEFRTYQPPDDGAKFAELYTVQRLKSSHVPENAQVVICTIQRLYSILRGRELDEESEHANPNELAQPNEPVPVSYNHRLPIEFFDVIVIDECHRSIYNLWRQVLDYFDSFLIGLTATPDSRTYGFFRKNVVSEYTYEQAVADGVNVDYTVYHIQTAITQSGARIEKGEFIDRRQKLTRQKRWTQMDEDYTYTGKQLDRDVVNPDQIRTVIREFRQVWPSLFPGREEVPKTLVFAKSDSHADDIIQVIREEFNEGNEFCKKVTYNSKEDTNTILSNLRNSFYPRIAVTVDMIATGTDVRPLEILLFMRDVKSSTYFAQMKGRGTRILDVDGLRKASPSAAHAKDRFVLVDAVGVTFTDKTASRPLDRKPSVPLKDLLQAVAVGSTDPDTLQSLASRLARLDKQLTPAEQAQVQVLTGGPDLRQLVRGLFDATDPDALEARVAQLQSADPALGAAEAETHAQEQLNRAATRPFTGKLATYLDNVRRVHEQVLDEVNLDELLVSGWAETLGQQMTRRADDFAAWLRSHQDDIDALAIYFLQPHRRREVTEAMLRQVLSTLRAERPALSTPKLWAAYQHLDGLQGAAPIHELAALVALIRRVVGLDATLTPYSATVNRNFQAWAFDQQKGASKFGEAEMTWLRMIKDFVATSLHITPDDLELTPFNRHGGLAGFHQVFGARYQAVLDELNDQLAA
jgi:type I restriction enzyme, R subunit